MDRETKKRLTKYIDARKEWEYWREEVKTLEATGPKISAQLSGMPGGQPDGSKTEREVEELEAARDAEAAAAEAMRLARLEVLTLIERAPEAEQRIVLRRRYLSGMGWEEIADRSGKSRQWVTQVHGTALKKIFASENPTKER